jgi:hypothetical protein
VIHTGYTVTTTTTIDHKFSPEAQLAISTYQKWLRATRRADKLQEQLEQWVCAIPDADMPHYVAYTEELDKG